MLCFVFFSICVILLYVYSCKVEIEIKPYIANDAECGFSVVWTIKDATLARIENVSDDYS